MNRAGDEDRGQPRRIFPKESPEMTSMSDHGGVARWAALIRAEYREMPGLCLTKPQMQRLWGFDAFICDILVDALVLTRVLRQTRGGAFVAFDSAH
jgi:hypothetical protein